MRLLVKATCLATREDLVQPVMTQTAGLDHAQMFKTDKLKALVHERLQAAAEDIFRLFERTITEYEEEVFRSKQEIDQRRRRFVCEASQQPSVQDDTFTFQQEHCKKEADEGGNEQKPPQVKEEQDEEVWTGPAGEKQEADTKDAMFNIIYVQRSDEEMIDNPLPSSSSGHSKVKPDQEETEESTSDCEMSEDANDGEWRDSGGIHSGTNRKTLQERDESTDRPHSCGICSKSFRNKYVLARHMMTHTGEKPYGCSVCGKSFIQRSNLQTHMNTHTGQKPYTCSFCGKKFTQVGSMNAHVRIHTGERPHNCADCGKNFKEKADLIKHAVIHTGEKPYSCSECNMKFSAQSNLRRHIKTHSGERPYSCTTCDKRFIRRSNLVTHMKIHAGDNL